MATVATQKRSSRGTEFSNPASELYANRMVFLSGTVDDEAAEDIISQLLFLESQKTAPITLIINSPGGSVSAGLAIIDCMRGISSEVATHVMGMAASMGATILACGEPGLRTAAPNAQVLIHQPLMQGMGGQASDIAIAAESIISIRRRLNQMLSETTGHTVEDIEQATDRDNRMDAEEALAFGIVDAIRAVPSQITEG